MYIARQLKEKNVAEYLLYMWQVEDLIRANHLDIEELKTNYISRFNPSPEQEKEMVEWYTNLIEMMRSEQVQEKGHLQINKNMIILLTDLHLQLLNSPKFPFYSAAYYKALPYIVEIRARNNNRDLPELESCFEILYGVMLLKMQKKAVSADTQKAVADISKLLGMLSDYYMQDKQGNLKFD
ncbi:DUF4924 family protein [Bacteroides sp. OF04-15BH]|jgi:hypothetical protein|uniref:DUF4924 family protein n=1 Tax=Bacteroides sp. OF04-15BH TaxID=2292281 RepID=UPI000E505966|nr:DUF4924 family protein [Bacteroides sp. OF04-15BH]RHP67319.1 DUF4924 family protein [Bacteroides sp. OF04-15BH]